MTFPARDLTRIALLALFMGGLILTTFWIIKPFIAALIWATAIVVATWPIMLYLQKRFHGRRWLATTAMTIGLLLVFILPFSLAAGTLIGNSEEISALSKLLVGIRLPAVPAWLANLPLVGEKLGALWQQVSTLTEAELAEKITPYSGVLLAWLAGNVGNLGMMLLQFILTVIIAAVLYSMGENASLLVRRFGHRLAGARGESTIELAAQAIRGVALGVVVTALIQALLGGIGLIATGTPFVAILTAVMFVLAIAQIGILPVLVPVIIWLYWKGDSGWATALVVWSIMVSSIDNILRPVLIRRGADLPLLLIFVGVIGGLLAFGLIGIFVGPVVLAVAYKLLEAWIAEDEI